MTELMNKIGLVAGLFLFSVAAVGDEFILEASGVCRLGGALVIAGDENPDSLWVIDDESQSTERWEVRGAEWNDLEDLSAVDDHQFFAMTSHSRTKKGKLKPKREQLLLISRGATYFEAEQSWSLREEILSALEGLVDIETAEEASPDEGGLNVEGLAYHRGQLFLGLRSPLTDRGEALMLRIENAQALLSGEEPVIAEAITLPLGKRGIRGLASSGTDLLVVAGSSGDDDESFSLYRWAPGTKKVTAFPLPDFATLIRPEGLVAENDGSFIFVQDFEEPADQNVVVKLGGSPYL